MKPTFAKIYLWGDSVKAKYLHIDYATYSIAIYVFEIWEGKFQGQQIAIPENKIIEWEN